MKVNLTQEQLQLLASGKFCTIADDQFRAAAYNGGQLAIRYGVIDHGGKFIYADFLPLGLVLGTQFGNAIFKALLSAKDREAYMTLRKQRRLSVIWDVTNYHIAMMRIDAAPNAISQVLKAIGEHELSARVSASLRRP